MSLDRRNFLKVSALGVAAGMLPRSLAAKPAAAVFTPVRRNVGFFTERGGVIGWLVNADGVLVVDSQFPDTAPLFLSGLRQRTARQIDVLVNSHHHGDHVGGNAVLRPAVRSIVAHTRAVENMRVVAQRSNTEVVAVDTTFVDEWSARVGDETVRAKYFGPAHTGGDVAIHFESANVVHLGDLLNNGAYPNIDGPSGASVIGWLRVMEQMAAAYSAETIFIYGHAGDGSPFTGGRDDLFRQRDYFTALLDAARRAHSEGRTREQAIQLELLPGFEHLGGDKQRLALGLGIAYDETQAGR